MVNWTFLTSTSELCLSTTLRSGQSFRWTLMSDKSFASVLGQSLVVLKEDHTGVYFREIRDSKVKVEQPSDDLQSVLKDYFQLDVSIDKLYEEWSAADPNFKEKSKIGKGVRILRQDPVENVFSFICSSNNNIVRITKMVNSLCSSYGRFVGSFEDKEFYAFPSAQDMALDKNLSEKLRDEGFGYRAKYIANTANILVEKDNGKPGSWLQNLRGIDYFECRQMLQELSGVGPKVADCICLMSMDKTEAIPVDTHVWAIAKRDYRIPSLAKINSVNEKAYKDIILFFRNLFGPYAGWAHSVLFTSDLKEFSSPTKKKPTTKKRSRLTEVESKENIAPKIEVDVKVEIKTEEAASFGRRSKRLAEVINR